MEQVLLLFQPPNSDGPDLLQVCSTTYAHQYTARHSTPAQIFPINLLFFSLLKKFHRIFSSTSKSNRTPHKRFTFKLDSFNCFIKMLFLVARRRVTSPKCNCLLFPFTNSVFDSLPQVRGHTLITLAYRGT